VGLDVGRLVRLGLVALVLGARASLRTVGLDVLVIVRALAAIQFLLLVHDRLLSRELDTHQTAGDAGIFPRLMGIATVAT